MSRAGVPAQAVAARGQGASPGGGKALEARLATDRPSGGHRPAAGGRRARPGRGRRKPWPAARTKGRGIRLLVVDDHQVVPRASWGCSTATRTWTSSARPRRRRGHPAGRGPVPGRYHHGHQYAEARRHRSHPADQAAAAADRRSRPFAARRGGRVPGNDRGRRQCLHQQARPRQEPRRGPARGLPR